MNCRIGDIAIVRSARFPNHSGKIVEVVAVSKHYANSWECRPDLQGDSGNGIDWMDSSLRPLRDDPGTDEMIRIAGLPERKGVTA